MTRALDGATFLCSTESELGENGEPKNFDEVFIQLYSKEIHMLINRHSSCVVVVCSSCVVYIYIVVV